MPITLTSSFEKKVRQAWKDIFFFKKLEPSKFDPYIKNINKITQGAITSIGKDLVSLHERALDEIFFSAKSFFGITYYKEYSGTPDTGYLDRTCLEGFCSSLKRMKKSYDYYTEKLKEKRQRLC